MLSLVFFLLLLGAVVAVIATVRQIMGNQKHLTDDIIRKFLLNQLSEREHDRTTAHLGICEACQERLHNYGKKRPLEDHLIDPNE